MVYRLVNSTYNVEELSLRLARLLCQFIKAEAATVYILDAKKNKLILKAIFNNKINILLKKKSDLSKITKDEEKVLSGFTVFEKHIIGIPMVADETVGAIIARRNKKDVAFSEFDKDMLSVIVEQSVTAVKNLQYYQEHQEIILGSVKFIGKLLEQQEHIDTSIHTPAYFKMIKAIGEKLNMPTESINNLYYASVLRDTGAIDVPYNIVLKSGKLTPEEFKVIKNQPARSAELIKPIEFLKPVLPIILHRNEKYDGTGYPYGLKKEQIPLGARIMSVVDAFEAMTRGRVYNKRLSVKAAIEEIKENSGTQFDPKVVDVFTRLTKQKKFKKFLSTSGK